MDHRGWTSRGYIPHCDRADLIQHIVFGTVGAGDTIEKNFGQRLLEKPAAAEAVQNALLHFDGERYRIWAWCVMSNHVHVVVQQLQGWQLARIVHSWKSFTANQINKIHNRTGSVWQRDYFDRFMRNDAELATAIYYVEQNPVGAGLVSNAADWPWSSAKQRRRP